MTELQKQQVMNNFAYGNLEDYNSAPYASPTSTQLLHGPYEGSERVRAPQTRLGAHKPVCVQDVRRPGAVESGRKFVVSRDEQVVGEGNDHVIMQRIACGIVVALRRVYLIIHERDVATPAGGGGVPRIPYSAFPVHV